MYSGQVVLLRTMKKADILKPYKDTEKWIAGFYDDNNKYQYVIVKESDIIPEEEYEFIRTRHNNINIILKGL